MQDPGHPSSGRFGQPTMILHDLNHRSLFAWFVEVRGSRSGQLYRLRMPTTTVGREAGNDIVLGDPAASARHAHVDVHGDETGGWRCTLIDDESANHTFVNGDIVGSHVLADGDRVVIGQTTLIFKRL